MSAIKYLRTANLSTSLTAGAVLGVLSCVPEGGIQSQGVILSIVFFGSCLLWVVGLDYLREVAQERKRRGIRVGLMVEKADFTRFYFPVWRRMLAWFGGAVAGAGITRTVLWLSQ